MIKMCKLENRTRKQYLLFLIVLIDNFVINHGVLETMRFMSDQPFLLPSDGINCTAMVQVGTLYLKEKEHVN